jgi:hypothetical protein
MTDKEKPSTYRKKPVVIQATQWFKNGDHPLDYNMTHDGLQGGELRQFSPAERKANGWEGDIVRYFRHPGVSGDSSCAHCGKTMHVHGWIDTLESGHIVCPGDWIITGVKGEHYPCKPDIFEATYEPAAPTSAPSDAAVSDERAAFEVWWEREQKNARQRLEGDDWLDLDDCDKEQYAKCWRDALAQTAPVGEAIYQVRETRSMHRPWIDTPEDNARFLVEQGRHEMRVVYATPPASREASTEPNPGTTE